MDIADALQTTIELARQNIADQLDHPDEHKEQAAAVDMVEKLAADYFSGKEEDQSFTTEGRLDHKPKARLRLSGTDIYVGTYHHDTGSTLYLHMPDEQPEPVYFSVAEGKLLIATLAASISELKEGDR